MENQKKEGEYSVTCLNRIPLGLKFPAGLDRIRIRKVEKVIFLVHGTKYDIRYGHDSG